MPPVAADSQSGRVKWAGTLLIFVINPRPTGNIAEADKYSVEENAFPEADPNAADTWLLRSMIGLNFFKVYI